MALYLDSANLEQIEAFLAFRRFGGITTNPSLLAREETTAAERLPQIIARLNGARLFAQVRERDSAQIIEEAAALRDLCPQQMVVKIPFCENGLQAVPELARRGVKSCLTAVFTAAQAYLAAAMGAEWVAVYVDRINKLGGDGLEVVRTICGIFEANRLPTRILAASVKTLEQIEALLEIEERLDVTIPFSLFQNFLSHPATEKALSQFALDAAKVFGRD